MKMQLKEQQEIADRELEDALNQQYMAQQDESSSAERKQLVSQIDELEAKLEDMDSALKHYEEENKQMSMLEIDIFKLCHVSTNNLISYFSLTYHIL